MGRDIENYVRFTRSADRVRLDLAGAWRIASLSEVRNDLLREPLGDVTSVVIDGSGLESIDTSAAALLVNHLKKNGIGSEQISLQGFKENHADILNLVFQKWARPSPLKRKSTLSTLEQIGLNATLIWSYIKGIVGFVGLTSIEMLRALRVPRSIRHKELFVQLEQACLNAVPIVCLVVFLIGVVIAYLSGIQTEQYGANIFVVDAVSIAMCREMAPIIVAIIVAGRSGSAYTAHIGTMKLNEEIDAMVAMGLSPMKVLVLPRIFALMLAMPILTFVGDVVGIVGGMIIADWRLGITMTTFITRLQTVVPVRSFMVGLIKAPVFALFIAVIGCRLGLNVENNARSIGLSTTATVVRSIVAVILLNAAFAIIFVELGI